MKKFIITTEYCENEYEHGEVRIERVSWQESRVEIESTFVVEAGTEEKMKEEIQEVIRRYAL